MSEGGESASKRMLASDAAPVRIKQKLPVAAAHHLEAKANQAAGLITQLVRNPVALGDWCGVEEPGGDVRIGRAEQTRIEGAQRKDEAFPPFRSKRAGVGTWPSSNKTAP